MTQLTYSKTQTTATLSAGIETNLLENGASGLTFAPFFQPGAGACLVPGGGDIVDILLTNNDVTNSINTVTIYLLADKGGTFAALSFTTSVSTTASRHIQMRGFTGAAIRVTGNSTSGTTASTTADVTVTASDPSAPRVWQLIVDGVVQGQALGGTITGNLAQSGGTVVLNSTGATTIDASTSVTIAGTAGSLALGRGAIVPTMPGGVSIASGKAVTGAGAMAVEATGALTVGGNASTTSIGVGQATVVANFVGGITVASAKAVTGLGALAVEAASGSTLTVGGASNALALGQAAKVATITGDADFQGAVKGHAVDAGAAGASGTASSYFGTFTIASGQAVFTLTNTKVGTTSLCFVSPLSNGATGAYIQKAVPTSNTLTVTFSTTVGADTKCAFMVVNPGA